MLERVRTPWSSVFLAVLGCSGSDGSHAMAAEAGRGGRPLAIGGGSNGVAGNGGTGITSGAPPISGQGGVAGASAGTGPSGGAGLSAASTGGLSAGTAGARFDAGATNSGDSSGSTGAGGRGPAPTFTKIYDTIITQQCGGPQCHLKRPTPFGYDFSSKSAASASWRSDVIAGNGADSPMFQVLNFGVMPKDKPPLSAEDLYLVLDWIDAGALDN